MVFEKVCLLQIMKVQKKEVHSLQKKEQQMDSL